MRHGIALNYNSRLQLRVIAESLAMFDNCDSEHNVKCCPHTAKAHAMSVRLNRDEG